MNLVIPAGLRTVKITNETMVAFGAFSDCKTLSSISISNIAVTIDDSCFNGCSNLANITLPFAGKSKTANSANPRYDLFGYAFGPTSYAGSYTANQYYSNQTSSYAYSIPTSLTSVSITDATQFSEGAF